LVSPDAAPLEDIYARLASGNTPEGPALEARGVDVILGGVQVLFDLSLTVQPGETVALLGNNGAGKTTTLRTLAGLQRPLAGSVYLDGFDVTALSAAGRAELGLGLVVGGNAVFGPLTVEENLRMYAYRLTGSEREVNRRVGRVREMFPWIAERSRQEASTLSGGEQQMLAVSQALLVQPRVLMIDEFSLGLAPRIVSQLMQLVQTITAEGTAVLLVEQSANVALNLAERLYVVERGRVVLEDAASELRRAPERLTNVYLQGSLAAEVSS
jgi:branched-chain amino acid transport system ATP-binding protein